MICDFQRKDIAYWIDRQLISRAILCKNRHSCYICQIITLALRPMKYADYQNTLSLQMIYAGYSEVGTEWCYKNVISPFTRIYLIDKGSASVFMNQREYKLKEGDLFIIPKFTFHEYACPESMAHYYICFIDQLIGGRNLFEYANIDYCPQASELDKYLMKRFIELNPRCALHHSDPVIYDNRPELFSISREKPMGELRMDIESSGILLLLFSRFLKEGTRSFSTLSSRMIQVFNYINNNLERRITIPELAGIMCISPDHFIRIFKQVNGLLPTSIYNGNGWRGHKPSCCPRALTSRRLPAK